MSDLHRDVTTRRCLTSYKQVEHIVIDCASLTDEIEQTDQLMRERKELFHKMWEEEQQRITIEQTIFKEQVRSLAIRPELLRSARPKFVYTLLPKLLRSKMAGKFKFVVVSF